MKPDCYKCKYRADIQGDCHSKCLHPEAKHSDPLGEVLAILASVQRVPPVTTDGAIRLNIKGNSQGIKNGWFNWPFNFDPIWLESCDGFISKNNSTNSLQPTHSNHLTNTMGGMR